MVSVLAEDAGDGVGGKVVVEVVVDLDGGRPAAGPDAFNFFDGEEAVGSDAFGMNSQLFLKAVIYVVCATQHATDIGADLDIEFAGGLEAKHGVVAGYVSDFKLSDADALGDFRDDGVGEVADFVLRVEEHGNEGGAPDRIFFDERIEARVERGRED
jgi:hypothetical protein